MAIPLWTKLIVVCCSIVLNWTYEFKEISYEFDENKKFTTSPSTLMNITDSLTNCALAGVATGSCAASYQESSGECYLHGLEFFSDNGHTASGWKTVHVRKGKCLGY